MAEATPRARRASLFARRRRAPRRRTGGDGRRDHGRDLRLRTARTADARSGDQRHPRQRTGSRARRTQRSARTDRRRLRRRRPLAAVHSAARRTCRATDRRSLADGRRQTAGRFAAERGHPAAGAQGADGLDPPVLEAGLHVRRSRRLRNARAGDGRLSDSRGPRPPKHPALGRNGFGQDDPAQ